MKKFVSATWIVAALFLFASCSSKSGKTGLLVPKDAAFVVHINNSSLSSKLSWQDIQQSNWFKEVSKEAKDTLAQQLFSDPSITGVDAKSDFVIFVRKHGKGAYIVIQGSLQDAAKFEAFVVKASEGKATPVKSGDITTAAMADSEDGVLTWDKSRFVFVNTAPLPDMSGSMRNYQSDEEKPAFKFSSDSLAYFGKETLGMDNDDKLDSDKRFVSLVKDGADIHLWFNSGKYYGDMMGPMMSMMGNMSAMLEDNVSAISFNFDNGKITMDSKQYYGKKLSSLFAKYPAKPVTSETIGRIPSENVVAVLAFNYPPEGLKEFLKVTELYSMANMAMAQMDYSVDEFVKANKGEVVLAVTDLEMKAKTDTMKMSPGGDDPMAYEKRTPDVKVLFATAVGDKGAFEKLITLIQDVSKGAMSSQEITHKVENNWFAVGNSADQVNQFLGGKANNKAPFVDKITGHPMGLFVDIQKILTTARADTKDSSALVAIDASLKTWQDVTGYGGEFKDKAYQFHAEINLVDKSTNSLKQLNTFLDAIYPTFKKMDKSDVTIEEAMTDSLAVPPPPPPARSN